MKEIRNTIYVKKENQIQKITFLINCEKLLSIRNAIIENCSRIEKVDRKTEITYNFKDYDTDPHYKNVRINIITYPYRDAGYGDDDHPGQRIVSYTYYDYPEIVTEINNILNEHSNFEGFAISFKDEPQTFNIETIEEQFKQVIEKETTKDKKEELRKLAKTLIKETDPKIKHPLHRTSEYFDAIVDCYEIEEIEIMNEEGIVAFFDFFSIFKTAENSEMIKKIIMDFSSLHPYQKKIINKKTKKSIINGNDEQIFAKYPLILYNKK